MRVPAKCHGLRSVLQMPMGGTELGVMRGSPAAQDLSSTTPASPQGPRGRDSMRHLLVWQPDGAKRAWPNPMRKQLEHQKPKKPTWLHKALKGIPKCCRRLCSFPALARHAAPPPKKGTLARLPSRPLPCSALQMSCPSSVSAQGGSPSSLPQAPLCCPPQGAGPGCRASLSSMERHGTSAPGLLWRLQACTW